LHINSHHLIIRWRIERRYMTQVLPVKIYTWADKEPSFIYKQYETFKKFVKDENWEFIVFNNREIIDEIKSMHPYAVSLSTAPVCIMVCGDTEKELANGFYQVDCSAAIENMLLAAKELGLDTCWMGVYPWEEVMASFSSRFKLPENIKPFALIALGYGAEILERPKRYDKNKIHYNEW